MFSQARRELVAEGFVESQIKVERFLNLRFEGTGNALMVAQPPSDDYASAFHAAFRREYGFSLSGKESHEHTHISPEHASETIRAQVEHKSSTSRAHTSRAQVEHKSSASLTHPPLSTYTSLTQVSHKSHTHSARPYSSLSLSLSLALSLSLSLSLSRSLSLSLSLSLSRSLSLLLYLFSLSLQPSARWWSTTFACAPRESRRWRRAPSAMRRL